MVAGRPREHDRNAIAQEMVEWAKLPNSINLCGFCCSRDPPINPRKITEWAKECKEFREAYETAKAFLGYRREEMLNEDKLHVKAYDLNAKTYDQFLKDESRQQLEFEASLKVEEKKVIDEKGLEMFGALMNQLGVRQSSDLNKDDKSKTNDSKS